MDYIIKILIGIIAAFHVYIMWFEMFAWETKGYKVFRGYSREFFGQTKVMAGNQGLYNGFLAAGLIWTFFISNVEWQIYVSIFFTSCVSIAGIYGAATADKKIFFVQALPALITLGLICLRFF